MPYVLAVSGLKDSGKTTLCGELLERLQKRGYALGYIKHSSHDLSSPENTDTGKIRARHIPVAHCSSGAVHLEFEDPPSLELLLVQCFPQADLVLLEGGKSLPFPRIWVGPPDTAPSEIAGIIGYWNRFREDVADPLEYGAGGEDRLVERIEKLLISRKKESLQVFLDNKKLPVKDFVGDFIAGGIRGMLGSLKGYSQGFSGRISLFLKNREDSEK